MPAEIGWGIDAKLLYQIKKNLSCNCVPATTTTTTTPIP